MELSQGRVRMEPRFFPQRHCQASQGMGTSPTAPAASGHQEWEFGEFGNLGCLCPHDPGAPFPLRTFWDSMNLHRAEIAVKGNEMEFFFSLLIINQGVGKLASVLNPVITTATLKPAAFCTFLLFLGKAACSGISVAPGALIECLFMF